MKIILPVQEVKKENQTPSFYQWIFGEPQTLSNSSEAKTDDAKENNRTNNSTASKT